MSDTQEVQSIPESIADASSLISKTFFMRVQYGQLGITRKVSGSQVLTTDADASLLHVSKTLIESAELDAIRKHDSLLRKWLGNMCLPFYNWPGVLVLPKAAVKTTLAKLKEHKAERDALVDALVAVYPERVKTAESKLGALWNALDYLPVQEVKGKFTFEWELVSLQTPAALKEIDPELYAQQMDAEQAKFSAATEEITAVMREKMLEMVEHLKDRLTPGADDKPKILKESAVNNLKEFLDSFDMRNVTDDKELAIEVAKARSLLNGTSANALRTSDEWREKIKAGMENITTTLGTLVEEKAGRKFRIE